MKFAVSRSVAHEPPCCGPWWRATTGGEEVLVMTSVASSCPQAPDVVDLAQEITLPPGTPTWITVDRVLHTMRVFGPRLAEPVTVDLAIEMLVNVGRLADFLYETRPRPSAASADSSPVTDAAGEPPRGHGTRHTRRPAARPTKSS